MTTQVDPIGTGAAIADKSGQPSPFFVRQWNNLLSLVLDVRATAAAALAATVAAAASTAAAAAASAAVAALAARNINTSGGLQGGGDLSADRTLSLTDTAVTPAIYGDSTHVSQVTVDQKGRVTGAANVAIAGSGGGSVDPSPFSDGGITKPAAADFTIADDTTANHGTGSKTNLATRGVALTHTQSGTPISSQTLFYKAAVSNTLDTMVAYIAPNFNDRASSWFYGLAVRDNTGKIHSFGVRNSGNNATYSDFRYTTVSALSLLTNLTGGVFALGRPLWLKLQKVSTNFVFSVSLNGETYTTVTTVSATAFVGATLNDVGFFVVNNLGVAAAVLNVDCFSFTRT